MPELQREDLQKIMKGLPRDLVTGLHRLGGILAGGYIRDVLCGQIPSDMDVFVRHPPNFVEAVLATLVGFRPRTPSRQTILEVSYPEVPLIQFIYKANSMEFVRDGFDYTVNCAMVDFQARVDPLPAHTWVHQDFYTHLHEGRLVLANEKNLRARNAVHRMMRHASKGFIADDATIARVISVTLAGALAKEGVLVDEESFFSSLTSLWRVPTQNDFLPPKRVVVDTEVDVDLTLPRQRAWRLRGGEADYDPDRRETGEGATAVEGTIEYRPRR